jgi:O-antigen/teichoic acid export membrane protein
VSRFSTNLAANFLGVGWLALAQLVCIPIYIRLLGMEAYGLIGFFVTLQAALQIFDLGLSPTLNREMARYSVQPHQAGEMRDLARTLELGYWGIGIVLGSVIALLAPVITNHWTRVQNIPVRDVTQAVRMMGAVVALQWPLSFYQGGLMGLQKQVLLNGIRILDVTLSSGGAVVALWAFNGNIVIFFEWQAAIALLHATGIALAFWASLPDAGRAARFNTRLIRSNLEFAAGMSVIAFFGMLLVQMDKVVLSKLLPLTWFGYYVLAGAAANGVQLFTQPMFAVMFPRLSALVVSRDEAAVGRLYHQGAQMLTVLIAPLTAVLAFFPFEVVSLWTGDAQAAQHAAPLLRLLALGTAINGLMHLPYALQLAHGWTRLGAGITVSMCVFFLPVTYVTASNFGAIGAAWVWLVLNVSYALIGIPLTHRRLLKHDAWRWVAQDIALPAAIAFAVVLCARAWVAPAESRIGEAVDLALALSTACMCAAVGTTSIRKSLFRWSRKHAHA